MAREKHWITCTCRSCTDIYKDEKLAHATRHRNFKDTRGNLPEPMKEMMARTAPCTSEEEFIIGPWD